MHVHMKQHIWNRYTTATGIHTDRPLLYELVRHREIEGKHTHTLTPNVKIQTNTCVYCYTHTIAGNCHNTTIHVTTTIHKMWT